VLVAGFGGGGNACDENFPSFFLAFFAGQELAIHLITGNVVGIALDERAKVLIRRGRVALLYAFEGEAVARKGVGGLLGDNFFERLTAGFLLFGHGIVPYYTGAEESVQARPEKRIAMKRKNAEERDGGEKLAGKPVSASRSEMTEIVLPAQTNPLGKLLGGHVMHLVDMAAAMAAHRHSNSYVVTASVDYIDFRNAVNLGEIVILKSQVNRVFRTSMEVGVEVYSENVLTGEKKHTTTAYVTFVAIDEHTRQPKPVPPLILKTAEERRRFREAGKRREVRLALRHDEKE
jgi:acyl-CoA hydrolase